MTKELEQLKNEVLVFDIETSAFYPDGKEINIKTHFSDYVQYAKCKWFGAYSYKHDTMYLINAITHSDDIKNLINQHTILVGFNNEEFDTPILYNNNLINEEHRYIQVDCLVVLGSSTFYRHDGLAFKNRGKLMGYKFKKNSLKYMAETMQLKTQKGDIDWRVFQKDVWSDEETNEIKKYLAGDVLATKQMFDKLWDFWEPFAEFISEENVKKLTWIKSSIASLTYQAACKVIGKTETYGEKSNLPPEEMGGRVIEPKYEEAKNVWYVDFASLYPHINVMFNIPAEINDATLLKFATNVFHKNDMFQTRGYYDITIQHPLALDIKKKLRTRMILKKEDPKNPLIYTYKIFLNSLYGTQRSQIFEQVYTYNAGWDICWLGQQIQRYTENRMKDFGFETIAGDTDSIFVINTGLKCEKFKDEELRVRKCLKTIVDEIKVNVPFPCDTFKIDIENYIDYIMWPFSDQTIKGADGKNMKDDKNKLIKVRKGKKKNYAYIYTKNGEKKIKLVGLPIIKDNATKLSKKIYDEHLKVIFLENDSLKIDKKIMNNIIEHYLSKDENLVLLAREFKVNPASSYKLESQIQAQISKEYFNDQAGVIELIKNKCVGKVGKSSKYCTVDEAIEAKLTAKDLDIKKIKNELDPFVRCKK